MKIAYVGLRGIPANYSGIERAVEEIGSRLAKMGHDVTVFCMKGRYEEKASIYKGVKLRYITTLRKKNLEMAIYTIISAILCAISKYDIVHFQAIGPSTFSLIPRIFGKKVIVTVHRLDWKARKWGPLAKLYLKIGEWTSINFPHRTIVVSKSLKNYYESRYRRKVAHIPNGRNSPIIRQLSKTGKDYGIESNKYLLFVGRLTEEKNVHILIKAFREIKTDMKLVIVGGTSYTEDYINYLKHIAADDSRVIFTGPIYNDNLEELYSNAYLFILPSEIEGLPVVLLEAISYGNVIVASDIPENLEIMKNGDNILGFPFKMGQAQDLHRVLDDLINNPEKVNKLKSGMQKDVSNKHTWSDISEKIINLYRDVLA
jgi:glycosyltransferase involved in cell wall biosynthesis